ncbi:MAG: ATP-binding protein [Clostridia bacterium]|nr:ATP-binding protein [Clostridia bacterium]
MVRFDTQDIPFEEKIVRLISHGQEGDYWDFKKEWYKSKTDLLHDIICMANNLSNRDAYIIIGVDEENNYRIASVENDSNRKNTQRIVDFLKDKKFAGGVRPIVYVETIKLSEGIIDVVVIENSNNTPFYLTDQFEGVKANSIYTRVIDTNTPIDKSADINNVEYLWRKRFRLDDTPLDIIGLYINDVHDWENSPIESEMCKYYKKNHQSISLKKSLTILAPAMNFICSAKRTQRRTGIW